MAQRNFNTNLTGEERDRIGALVKEFRNSSGLSQRKQAFQIGFSPVRIINIEKGSSDYFIDTLIVIFKYFNHEVSFI